MKPFLKWAGGKYKLVDKIKAVLPHGNRLIEPFAGSGSVFLNTEYKEFLIADSNSDLINLYKTIQSEGEEFVDECAKFFIPENNCESAYYGFRDLFNNTNDLKLKSILFVYLNRHCFNGLCRYNSKGFFNVPFGRYSKPFFPENELRFFVQKSKITKFIVSDFVTTMASAKAGDIVYCDPPYVPLSVTSNFTKYTMEGFGWDEQKKLAEMAFTLMGKGIPVIISNHDTDFTRKAYSLAKIDSFEVQRFISSNALQRNKASELLAVFS